MWDEESFLKALSEKGQDEVAVARAILDWTKTHPPFRVEWGRGSKQGSAQLTLDYNGNCYVPIVIWTYGKLEVQFQQIKERPPFTDEAKRREFLNRLNSIPGVSIPANSLGVRPPVPLSALTDGAALDRFLDALGWFIQEVKGS